MHDYVVALIGGGMIGLAAVMLMIGQGRVMGVSGIASTKRTKTSPGDWPSSSALLRHRCSTS